MKIARLDSAAVDPSPVATGVRIAGGRTQPVAWHLAEEAAIAFLVNGEAFAVMMATPADLEDFALGFLLSERVISHPDQLEEIRIIEVAEGFAANCILPTDAAERAEARRRTLTGRSGCGLCGTETLAEAMPDLPRVSGPIPHPDTVIRAFEALPGMQVMNAVNHSTHAAAFFSLDGHYALVREDVGRHNALDKLGGALAVAGRSAAEGFLILSSRMSVEMVQKAAIFGAPFVASVSAPTALALRVAAKAGMAIAARSGAGLMLFNTTGNLRNE